MSQRICESCQHPLLRHMYSQEGYSRPCLIEGCNCDSFTDSLHRAHVGELPPVHNLAWDKSETAVVHRKPDGSYRFPMRNDAPVPPGCERVEIRSDRDMARVEREAGVLSERRHFDRNGRGHEKPLPPIPAGVYSKSR
jgi:hypothetical protein